MESKFLIVEDDKNMILSTSMLVDALFLTQALIASTTKQARDILEGIGVYSGNIVTILDGQFPEDDFSSATNQFERVLDMYSDLPSRTGEKDFFIANSGDEFCNNETVRKIEEMYGGRATLLSGAGKPNAVSEGLKKYGEIIAS